MNKFKWIIWPLITGVGVTTLALQAGEGELKRTYYRGGTKDDRTSMDLPGDNHKYYGQRFHSWRDNERKLAKLDLDGDFNYDGVIDNHDPADNGAFQQTPPGLVVGDGEMSKLILRLRPYRLDFKGEAVVTMEVAGVNRNDKSGQFESFADETSQTGRIRVWLDEQRRTLLLDSGDPEKRYFEWRVEDQKFASNLPGVIPRKVYVEGMKPSGEHAGDLRILVTVSHLKEGEKRGDVLEELELKQRDENKKLFKRFRTSFDHILLTVNTAPHAKEFVNNNAERVWLSSTESASSK